MLNEPIIDEARFNAIADKLTGEKNVAMQTVAALTDYHLSLQDKKGNTLLKKLLGHGDRDVILALIERSTPEQLSMPNQDGGNAVRSALLQSRRFDGEYDKIVKAITKKVGKQKIEEAEAEIAEKAERLKLKGWQVIDGSGQRDEPELDLRTVRRLFKT